MSGKNFLTICMAALLMGSCGAGDMTNENSDSSSTSANDTNSSANTGSNSGAANNPDARDFKGTREDSQKTQANPLYKGDNSDTL